MDIQSVTGVVSIPPVLRLLVTQTPHFSLKLLAQTSPKFCTVLLGLPSWSPCTPLRSWTPEKVKVSNTSRTLHLLPHGCWLEPESVWVFIFRGSSILPVYITKMMALSKVCTMKVIFRQQNHILMKTNWQNATEGYHVWMKSLSCKCSLSLQ